MPNYGKKPKITDMEIPQDTDSHVLYARDSVRGTDDVIMNIIAAKKHKRVTMTMASELEL